jgi:hypothetical protein
LDLSRSTPLGAGGRHSIDKHFGVTACLNGRLRYQNLAAYGTMLALGHAVGGAGSSYAGVDHLDVLTGRRGVAGGKQANAYQCKDECKP